MLSSKIFIGLLLVVESFSLSEAQQQPKTAKIGWLASGSPSASRR